MVSLSLLSEDEPVALCVKVMVETSSTVSAFHLPASVE